MDIQHLFADFQRKAKCYEMPTDDSFFIGIFVSEVLVGYFVLAGYDDGDLEIQQGYLRPIAQHKRLSYTAMKLLHEQARLSGFKKIILKASRTLRAYTRFMRNLGYVPESIIFSRSI